MSQGPVVGSAPGDLSALMHGLTLSSSESGAENPPMNEGLNNNNDDDNNMGAQNVNNASTSGGSRSGRRHRNNNNNNNGPDDGYA
jgi:hypothetical protein